MAPPRKGLELNGTSLFRYVHTLVRFFYFFSFLNLVHYLLLAFHWNACFFHLIHRNSGFGGPPQGAPGDIDLPDRSAFSELRYPVPDDSVKTYLMSYYWSVSSINICTIQLDCLLQYRVL